MPVGRKRRERASHEKEDVHDSQQFSEGLCFSPRDGTWQGSCHPYRVRSVDGTWKHKAETVNSPRRKDADKILAERLREVNRGLKLPVETSFEQFSADHWETYVSQNLKPSTQ